jgi:hypothetical protein
MSETLVPALVLLGFIGLIISFLVFVNNRDRKKDAAKKDSGN